MMREFWYSYDVDTEILVFMDIDEDSVWPIRAEYADGRPFELSDMTQEEYYALKDECVVEWCDQMLMDDPR